MPHYFDFPAIEYLLTIITLWRQRVSQEIKEGGLYREASKQGIEKQQRSNPERGCKTTLEKLYKGETQGA